MVSFRVDARAEEGDVAQLWPVYESVFGDFADYETWRSSVWDKHSVRGGFRLARAYDGDTLVGFAYGYTGERGQWWTDNALKVLAPRVAQSWLGGHFELVSLGVLPAARCAGIGRGLMRALLRGLPHKRLLLMNKRLLLMTTAQPTDPARLLYASEGWNILGPGIGDATVIMGRREGE